MRTLHRYSEIPNLRVHDWMMSISWVHGQWLGIYRWRKSIVNDVAASQHVLVLWGEWLMCECQMFCAISTFVVGLVGGHSHLFLLCFERMVQAHCHHRLIHRNKNLKDYIIPTKHSHSFRENWTSLEDIFISKFSFIKRMIWFPNVLIVLCKWNISQLSDIRYQESPKHTFEKENRVQSRGPKSKHLSFVFWPQGTRILAIGVLGPGYQGVHQLGIGSEHLRRLCYGECWVAFWKMISNFQKRKSFPLI